MARTAELVKCHCGMRMLPTPRGAMVCENCDQLQPQETMGMRRNKTREDVRFDMYWLQVFNNEYRDNTLKPPATGTTEGERYPT